MLLVHPINQIIVNLDNQISSIRNSLKESLNNQLNTLKIKVNEINKQKSILDKRLSNIPSQEKNFKEIYRQQQIKENLYLFLLQKREETTLSLAITVSNSKTIEDPSSNSLIISPKKNVIYLVAFLIGIFIPVIILYLKNLLDNKIHGIEDINNAKLPLIGDIPLNDENSKIVVSNNKQTSISEAFRLLRTNINLIPINY